MDFLDTNIQLGQARRGVRYLVGTRLHRQRDGIGPEIVHARSGDAHPTLDRMPDYRFPLVGEALNSRGQNCQPWSIGALHLGV